MSFEFLLLRLKFPFWNSLLQLTVLRPVLWIKKRVMWGKGKKSSCMCLLGGKVEHCAWLTVKGPGAGANHTASKWREDLWKPSFLGLVWSMGILGKLGMPGLIKCVIVQDGLQRWIFYIYNSLLGYLARTHGNGKKYVQLKNFAFQCWLVEAANTPLFKGRELGGQWAGKRYLKSEDCMDKSCSPDSVKVRHRPLLSKSSSVCSLNYREETTFAQQWRAVPVALESRAFISKLGNHINLIALFAFLKNR